MPQSDADGLSGRTESAIGGVAPASENKAKEADEAKAKAELRHDTVSEPGGFKNDPDDPTNPNEAIERHRRKVRP